MSSAQSLRSADTALGFWCSSGDPSVVEAAVSVGPDFVCIDTQHGPAIATLDASLFTLLAWYDVPGLVRVESGQPTPIGRALDLGASGVMVPLVDSASDAEKAVAATRYAPGGVRSFGMQTRRVGPFDEEPYVIIQVETAEAMENIDAIASVEGVDALYIGPADLGLALCGTPAPDVDSVFDGSHPHADVMVETFRVVVAAAKRHEIAAGLHCGTGASAARALGEGFTLAAVAADLGLIASGLSSELALARKPDY